MVSQLKRRDKEVGFCFWFAFVLLSTLFCVILFDFSISSDESFIVLFSLCPYYLDQPTDFLLFLSVFLSEFIVGLVAMLVTLVPDEAVD